MSGHEFTRPGNPFADAALCHECGQPEAAHRAGPGHDVRFYGRVRDYGMEGGEIVARCEPCRWSVQLEGAHDIADLTRLVQMHAGITGPPPAATASHVAPDGSGWLTPGDLETVREALSDAVRFTGSASYRQVARLLAGGPS